MRFIFFGAVVCLVIFNLSSVQTKLIDVKLHEGDLVQSLDFIFDGQVVYNVISDKPAAVGTAKLEILLPDSVIAAWASRLFARGVSSLVSFSFKSLNRSKAVILECSYDPGQTTVTVSALDRLSGKNGFTLRFIDKLAAERVKLWRSTLLKQA